MLTPDWSRSLQLKHTLRWYEAPMRFHVASTVRSAAFRSTLISLAKTSSIGLRSGLQRQEEYLYPCGADGASDGFACDYRDRRS